MPRVPSSEEMHNIMINTELEGEAGILGQECGKCHGATLSGVAIAKLHRIACSGGLAR